MKVVILAGGWGSRLGNLSEQIPKPMVEIGGKPILWHIMKIYSSYGFNDFVIALGVKGHLIKDYFLNYESYNLNITKDFTTGSVKYHEGSMENWKVTMVNTGINTLKGARLKLIEPFLDEETNLLTYGDGLADINIKESIDFHFKHNKTITLTGVRPSARFGELSEENGIVKSFEEKPKMLSGLINGGFMIFNSKIFDHLTTNQNCDLEYGAFESLAKKDEVMVYKHKSLWQCMDVEQDVVHLNKLWDKGNPFWKVW